MEARAHTDRHETASTMSDTSIEFDGYETGALYSYTEFMHE